jgi:hypothetical protein
LSLFCGFLPEIVFLALWVTSGKTPSICYRHVPIEELC